MRQMLKPESKEQAEKDLISSIDHDTTSLEQAVAGLSLLDEWGSTTEIKASYSNSARRRWVEASVFPQ